MTQQKASRRHPILVALVLGGALVLAAGLSQCRMVGDSVTGVDLRSAQGLSGRNQCIKRCNEAFEDAMDAEQDRHKRALRACGTDRDCKREEEQLHDANTDRIKAQKRACKTACYNEGSGDNSQ